MNNWNSIKIVKINNEKGAITLFVLMACLFFTFILSGIYISNMNKLQVQEQQINQIQNNYKGNIENIQEICEDLQKKPIQINGSPPNVTYNGKQQKWEPIVTDENNVKLVKNTDYEITYSDKNCTDAGKIEVTVTGKGKYIGQYTFNYTIEKAKLKVKTGSKEKEYDGTELTCSEITVEGFVNGETATFYTYGSQILVGSSHNVYKIEFNKTAKESNYEVLHDEDDIGILTVRAVSGPSPGIDP